MNSIQCPQCGWVSPASALECPQCHSALSPHPGSLPGSLTDPAGNKTGRLTYLWYRIYCLFMMLLNLCAIGLGIFMIVSAVPGYHGAGTPGNPRGITAGWVIIGAAIVFSFPFMAGLILPRKPWTWMFGIVLMALGMTSICFLPFVAALLIFWIKPETQAYFGRKNPETN